MCEKPAGAGDGRSCKDSFEKDHGLDPQEQPITCKMLFCANLPSRESAFTLWTEQSNSTSETHADTEHQRVGRLEVGCGADKIDNPVEDVANLDSKPQAPIADTLHASDKPHVAIVDRVPVVCSFDCPCSAAELAGEVAPPLTGSLGGQSPRHFRCREDQFAAGVLIGAPQDSAGGQDLGVIAVDIEQSGDELELARQGNDCQGPAAQAEAVLVELVEVGVEARCDAEVDE